MKKYEGSWTWKEERGLASVISLLSAEIRRVSLTEDPIPVLRIAASIPRTIPLGPSAFQMVERAWNEFL